MAEMVLCMASSVLTSAVSKATAAAAEEISSQMGVRQDICFMKDELERIQAFLESLGVKKRKDESLRIWEKQVRDLSYDIEDCLDDFRVDMGRQSLLGKLIDRHNICGQIRKLKSKVEAVSRGNERYNEARMETSDTSTGRESLMEDIRNHSPSNIDEAQLVGFANRKKKLFEMINFHADYGHTRVICVVGGGGLGKTTLARKIYDSKDDINRNFSCHAWTTISQSFDKSVDLLKDMIRQLFGKEKLEDFMKQFGENAERNHLASYLAEELKDKRYFIVLDDLWEIDAWKWINSIAFPSTNMKGSCILVTTRNADLAKECTSESLIYYLSPLDINDAIDLLLAKTQKTQEDIANNEDLRNIVTQLATKCGCIPLAIVTLGGILASKKIEEWRIFYKKIPYELERNPSLEPLKRMVKLSYNHLPAHLKPCFLYLCIFPEDFKIKRSRLVERWIGEGLVKARNGMTPEEVGEHYFNELISRSMIIPSSDVNYKGVVRSCWVHDIIRDVIVLISTQENFVYTITDDATSAVENFRHVAYHGSGCIKTGMDWDRVRSLTFFGGRTMELESLLCSSKFRMLRTLDLENADFGITGREMKKIGLLRHLTYMNIRGINISTLPTEFTKLNNLRILHCENHGSTLCKPSDDPQKRNRSCGVKFPTGIGNLKELRILEYVDIKRTHSKAIEELGDLIWLQKLSVVAWMATEKNGMILCKAISKLSSLRSLCINADNDGTVEWIGSVTSLPSLRSLRLVGLIGDKVNWFKNLTQLVKLRLSASRLEGDKTMEILGALPKLRFLHLDSEAYIGKHLVFRQGAFPNLWMLFIWNLKRLKEIGFEQGAGPQMEFIIIGDCKLEAGINGVKHLSKLREFYLSYEAKVARLGMIEKEVYSLPNKPWLRLEWHWDRSYHDLGDGEGYDNFFDATESLPEADGSDDFFEAMESLPYQP